MATDLKVYGPYDIAFSSNGSAKRITTQNASDFWSRDEVAGLKLKQGCYVFCKRAGRGFVPWYVGKAGKGFKQEVFTDHKLKHYNDALFQGNRGTPVLFFIAPFNNVKKVHSGELSHMEKELIQYAVRRNPELRNVQNTNNMPQWSIKGVIRSAPGRAHVNEIKFKTMMKIK